MRTLPLTRTVHRSAGLFISPKSGKPRTITAVASVMHDLRKQKLHLTEMQLRAGDDIKSAQGNLGHSTTAFTLDRYGHFTEAMRQASATRIEGFIKNVLNL